MDNLDMELNDSELGKISGGADFEASWKRVFTNMKNQGYSYEHIMSTAINGGGRSAENVAIMTRILNEVFGK